MKEEEFLSKLTVIYVSLTDSWGTLERRCLKDASFLQESGGAAFVLCQKKTIIDSEAEKRNIPRLYFQGSLTNLRSKLNFYFQIHHILQKQRIDLIHCYDSQALILLGIILRRLPHLPMVFTFNKNISFRINGFIFRWFLPRTDAILTFSKNIQDLAAEIFPIKKRKIHLSGLGIHPPEKTKSKALEGNLKKIALIIPRTHKDTKNLQIFIDMIPPLLHYLKHRDFGQEIIFSFYTDISWYNHEIFEELKRIILERHLEMHVSFESKPLNPQSFLNIDILVVLPSDELITDLEVYSLLAQTPVLLPRTSTRHELVKQDKLGETYHPDDGRELRDKLIKILFNLSRYSKNLEEIESELQEHHLYQRYNEHLSDQYKRLYLRRQRYSQKRLKIVNERG